MILELEHVFDAYLAKNAKNSTRTSTCTPGMGKLGSCAMCHSACLYRLGAAWGAAWGAALCPDFGACFNHQFVHPDDVMAVSELGPATEKGPMR